MRTESMILVQTGIRDTDVLSSVENSLLEQLRSILAKWMSRPFVSESKSARTDSWARLNAYFRSYACYNAPRASSDGS
jgi:hypothetical protein